MDIICNFCQRRCCNCQGCNPVFINNKWVCPNCISRAERETKVYNSFNPNHQWQLISHHLEKK